MLNAQLFKMELDHLVVLEDLDLVQEHLEVDKVHLITGLLGLASEAVAETACTELQAVAVAEDLLVAEDLVAVAQEDHKQSITVVEQAWMEQVQVAEETILLVELDKKEVLA
jgi:hypothetical protein